MGKLLDRCSIFLKSCPPEDRLDLRTTEPTIDGVLDLVGNLCAASQAKKQSGFKGKAKRYFHMFCGKLDSYQTILGIIPSNNDYISVFMGAISIIVQVRQEFKSVARVHMLIMLQASVNHERIAEGLSEALCGMSEGFKDSQTELDLFPTMEMKKCVADLYAHIFLFLSDVLDWFMERSRKRTLKSFNGNLRDDLQAEIQKIRYKSDAIRNLGAQSSRAELRDLRVSTEAARQDLRLGLTGAERHHAEVARELQKLRREIAERVVLREEDGLKFQKQLANNLLSLLQDKALIYIQDTHAKNEGKSSSPHRLAEYS
jgi:hypothetical protein